MQYLKNALGGIGRNLHDSALHAFQGPHRWWKLAFFAAMFVLPGGSVVIALAAWFDHRRHQRGQGAAPAAQADSIGLTSTASNAATGKERRRGAQNPAPLAARALCAAAQRSLQATLRQPYADSHASSAQAPMRP